MPIHNFKCVEGHTTEKIFLTFGAAENVITIPCSTCHGTATRVEWETPLKAHIYGAYSVTKRHSYRHVSRKYGNRGMAGKDSDKGA